MGCSRTSSEVSIVITCVDMLEMTRRCVDFMKKNTPPIYELIIVADECSNEMLTWLGNLEAKVITNPKRVGSSTALNMGIKVAEGQYIALVNNDISVSEGWLEPLITALQEHPNFGWVTSRVTRGQVVSNFCVACSLFSKEALDKVGLFDERFSQGEGWDDNDILLRFWLAGYQPHGVSRSVIYHPAESATLTALYGPRQQLGRAVRCKHNIDLFIEKWGPEVMNTTDWVNMPYI